MPDSKAAAEQALSMESLADNVPQTGGGAPDAVQPPAGAPSSELAFGPSDAYDYAQHLLPINVEGAFVQRAGVVRSTADDAASRAEMDDDLWAALHGDGAEGEGEEVEEEAFIEDLLEVHR